MDLCVEMNGYRICYHFFVILMACQELYLSVLIISSYSAHIVELKYTSYSGGSSYGSMGSMEPPLSGWANHKLSAKKH